MLEKQYQSQSSPLRLKSQSSISSQSQQNVCIRIRNLDSGQISHVDPSVMTELNLPMKARTSSMWEGYWEERQNNKQILLKLVNEGESQKLSEVLMGKNIDLNDYIYMDGWTLLHHAVSRKYVDVALTLINYGCNVNIPTEKMLRTPLHLAVLQKHEEMIELLLSFNANPNAIQADFCTPLHYATQLAYVSVTHALLNSEGLKFDFSIKNNKGMTAIDCCRDIRIIELIKQYCQIHACTFTRNPSLSRIVEDINGDLYVARNHSDFIQKILNNADNVFSKTGQKDNVSRKNSEKSSSSSNVGKRINKQKMQRLSQIAKKSIISYKESLIEAVIQSLNNYDIIRKIGSGSFGTVFLVRRKQTSKFFALKKLDKQTLKVNKMKKYAYAERQILKTIQHPFILHASSFFQDEKSLYIVMDFCEGGDLQKYVRENKFNEEKARKYCCEVILALEELHRLNYLFRDLKASNVLLDKSGHIKLADFGLAKQSQVSHSFLGSVAYLAPEMLVDTDNKPHTSAIDWYLLGVFVYEMVTGFPPFYNENRMCMFDQIKRSNPKIPVELSTQCQDFLLKTLAKRPEKRLGSKGADEVKAHSWFKGIDWKQVLDRNLQMQIPIINQKQLKIRQHVEQLSNSEQKECIQNYFHGWDHKGEEKN